MTNDEATTQAEEGLTSEEKDIFARYIVGGASIWIDSARWRSLVASARAYIEARRQRLAATESEPCATAHD